MQVLHRLAPAKINLGLEILGKRDDGFHEIRSILARITLADELIFSDSDSSRGVVSCDPPSTFIDPENNLVCRAIARFNRHTGLNLLPDVTLTKRIPVASGLGGASSDAATTLLAMNALAGNILPAESLHLMASSLGSDVPFFLGSPTAQVMGRGTDLRASRTPQGHVLIVTPNIRIDAKTATLYRALLPSDFSNGKHISRQAAQLNEAGSIDPSLLGNTFMRPILHFAPEIAPIMTAMQNAGCPVVALSGAGPTLYSLLDSQEQATSIKEQLLIILPVETFIATASFEDESSDQLP